MMESDKLRITLVVGRFPQLSETFIFRKAVTLARRGHSVTVLTRDIGDWNLFRDYLPLPDTLRVERLLPDIRLLVPNRTARLAAGLVQKFIRQPVSFVKLLRHTFSNGMTATQSLQLFIGNLPFLGRHTDIVHFEFLSLAPIYPQAAALAEAHEVISCRGADLHLLEQKDEGQQRQLIHHIQSAGAIHAVSSEMALEITRVSGRTSGIWINRPAVDVDTIRPPSARSPNAVPLILAVGRLVWKKGFDYLLAAASLLKKRHVPFRLQIIGDGKLYTELRFSIWDLGLEDEVELCGGIKPALVLERLKQADLLVLSSHEEGISNAVLEAMATGLPIVTTNAGGMEEAVTDGVEGFVVPVRDIDALAERLEHLLTHPELRAQMGKAARARAEAQFSLTRQAQVFEQLYQSLLTPAPTPNTMLQIETYEHET